MATLIGKPLGKAFQFVNNKVLNNSTVNRVVSGPANKLWRAAILLSRVTGPMPKYGPSKAKKDAKKANNYNKHYAIEGNMSKYQRENPWLNLRSEAIAKKWGDEKIEDGKKRLLIIDKEGFLDADTISRGRYANRGNEYANNIRIVNNMVSPYQYVELQNRPWEMRVEPTSSWAAVKSMGRNNPFMVYTGGEDSITLEVSWYAEDEESRLDVLAKCRLLEAWSRADGYMKSPPVLNIYWGTSGMFLNDGFVLTSAAYTLTNFQDTSAYPEEYRDPEMRKMYTEIGGLVENRGLLPTCANQTLVFKRVSGINRTYLDMVGIAIAYKGPNYRGIL